MSKYTLSRVSLLRRARMMIASGAHRFICVALYEAASDYDSNSKSMTAAKAYVIAHDIQKMLGEFNTYEKWMAANHPLIYSRMTNGDFRQARLQWVDAMIAYYAKEKL